MSDIAPVGRGPAPDATFPFLRTIRKRPHELSTLAPPDAAVRRCLALHHFTDGGKHHEEGYVVLRWVEP